MRAPSRRAPPPPPPTRCGRGRGKDALAKIQRRLFDRNPRVVLYTLSLLETMVKNCGAPVQSAVATKPFMDEFRRLIRGSIPAVKKQALALVQTWALAFDRVPQYKPVHSDPPLRSPCLPANAAATAGGGCVQCAARRGARVSAGVDRAHRNVRR